MLDSFFAWYNGLTDTLPGSLGLFVVGVLLLIKGGDWFVDSAVGIAKRFRVPEIIIGATVVSIGTTLPEVMVSVTAAVNNNGAIAYGNAIGSIICNTALIAALTIAIRPATINRKAVVTPVLFFFGSAAIYMLGRLLMEAVYLMQFLVEVEFAPYPEEIAVITGEFLGIVFLHGGVTFFASFLVGRLFSRLYPKKK